MIIFVDQVTERLQYTFDFVFNQHGLPYKITNDLSVFLSAEEDKFSYSSHPFDQILSIAPSNLLFDEHIDRKLILEKKEWNETEFLAINGVIDPFAAIFYVISRYEEYTNPKRDQHDRFQAVDSIQYRFGWLQQQIVERWVTAIVQQLIPSELERFETTKEVTVIPSFDIDNTFAFKWKDGWRKWISFMKDFLKGNKERIKMRKLVHSQSINDPYDSFDVIRSCGERFSQTRVFWLLGDWGEYDRNISWRDPRHQRLIRTMAQLTKVGLHPSYASNVSDKRLMEEKQRIDQILQVNVTESRQHFLKIKLPQTYRRLLHEGFETDFSMGYADQPGFRLGTAHPVMFFDLEQNQMTNLKLIPFVYMDGTFNEYLQITVKESKQMIRKLSKEVKQYGGVFCFIWHNETISNSGKWNGWSLLLDETLQLFSEQDASSSQND